MHFLCSSVGKESTCKAGDLSSIPGLGRFPGEGKGCPFQYSGLENSMDFIVHQVMKSWTWLSNFPSFLPCWFGWFTQRSRFSWAPVFSPKQVFRDGRVTGNLPLVLWVTMFVCLKSLSKLHKLQPPKHSSSLACHPMLIVTWTQ